MSAIWRASSFVNGGRTNGLGWGDAALRDLADALESKYAKKVWAPTEEEKANMMAQITESVKANF